MTKVKVSIVQKARYGMLFLPVLWVLFSLWVVINVASSEFSSVRVQEVHTVLSISEIINIVYPGCLTLWAFSKILLAIKQHNRISVELKSGFAFVLGITIMTISGYFYLGQFLFYVGFALTDIAAVLVIITLLQRKSFGGTTLYHKDVQLRRV